jgi:HPt (histidine-containing phosphotransfer) domain-containing protein
MSQRSPETQPAEAYDGAAAIDLRHLSRYTLGDPALEAEVLGLFAEQLPDTIDALKEACCDKAWYTAAHTLKGSARAVGAWRLAQLAEQAERVPSLATVAEAELVAAIETAAREAGEFIAALAPARGRS